MTVLQLFGDGLKAKMAEDQIRTFFEAEPGEEPAKSYIIYLSPVTDEAGNQRMIQKKNFVGKVISEEPETCVMIDPYTHNIAELNNELYNALITANQNVEICNNTIHNQNALIAQKDITIKEQKEAFERLQKRYKELLDKS